MKTKLTIGETLANGFILLAFAPTQWDEEHGVVLARSKDNSEFATWKINAEGETFWGNYSKAFDTAMKRFVERVQESNS
jgi:hypothetical protein